MASSFKIFGLPVFTAVSLIPWDLQAQTKLPVISKLQMIYSMVGHYSAENERIDYYNTRGLPSGNTNYVVPYLAYDLITTLYNPYNTELKLTRSRLKFSYPPVGFRFKKNSDYLRSGWSAGGFSGLAQLQIANDSNQSATKTFTLVLGGGNSENYNGDIILKPGEARLFSVRVQSDWTWARESPIGPIGGLEFYDWGNSSDFTNKDHRTLNDFGVECVAGLNFRAGFQVDHLSVNESRPIATYYSFELEDNRSGGWVAIKKPDTVTVEATGMNTNLASPGFSLSLLKGQITNASTDVAKTYPFNITNLSPAAGSSVISRDFTMSDILQTPTDTTIGGKKPFAVFSIVAKSKALQQMRFQATVQPPTDQLYESTLAGVASFTATQLLDGPSDGHTEGITMNRMERIGDLFVLDVVAPSYSSLKVKGTADLTNGFTDNLTSLSSITEGPEGTGIYKVSINVAGRGPNYFVRVEL